MQIDQLGKSLAAMDSRLDKQKFIESNNITFMIPKKFEYSPVRRDEVSSMAFEFQMIRESSPFQSSIDLGGAWDSEHVENEDTL